MASFKITYKTSSGERFDLTIPNAFDYNPDEPEDAIKINNAAQEILEANAIEDLHGDPTDIVSIVFYKEETETYDLTD